MLSIVSAGLAMVAGGSVAHASALGVLSRARRARL
jgi:hypothetical protein